MKKLLIVDDSKDLLEAMQFFLEKKGFLVKTIDTNTNVHNQVAEFDPDLIILDVFIHGKDSRYICKELRKHNDSKYICILLFSSSATALENYVEYHADGCLEKPFGLNNLLLKIENLLSNCKDKVDKQSN